MLAMPFIRKLTFNILILICSVVITESKEIMTLSEVQSAVLKNCQKIKVLDSEVKAAKALIMQAGFRPNPELEFGVENGLGTDGVSFNKFEVGISQAFELGHKKEARIHVADKKVNLAELAFKQIKRELKSVTIRKVIPIISAKEQLHLIEEIITITTNIHLVIKKRVASGAAREIDLLGTEIELEELTIERKKILDEIESSLQNLSNLMGNNKDSFNDISTKFSNNYSLPSYAELEKKLLEHNEFALNKREQALVQAEIQELKADAVADLTIGVGYERNQEEEANAAFFNVAIDLPIFNKNQGDIAEKKETITALKHQSKNTYQQLQQELREQYNAFQNIVKQISTIKIRTLPRIEKIYQKMGELYEKSGVQIFDVIDTQIKLVETKMLIIDLKTELAVIAADIYEITGYLSTILTQ